MTTALTDHLQAILDREGALTPLLVVEEARLPGHPLHSSFEWDDSIAGEKYRHVQARELIRSAVVVYRQPDGAPVRVRAFHSINRVDGPSYVPIAEIAEDPMMRKVVLQGAEREWKTLLRKYSHLEEFMDTVRRDTEAA